MSVQKLAVNAVDMDGQWLYRVGGISALVFALAYVVIIALYVPMGAPPNGAEARLASMAGNTTAWWLILALSVLTDFLLVPVIFSLYLALKGINRGMMLVASAFMGLFILLDLALTWTNYAALITLSGQYATATDGAQRAALITIASYPTAVLESHLLDVYNTVTLAIGILLAGIVMLKRIFSKSVAYLGIITGILGIVAVAGPFVLSGLSTLIIVASLLTTIWVFLVGYKLYRLGQR